MVKIAAASLFAGAQAGTLAVTWKDCGAQHASVDTLSPLTIQTGGSTTVIGSGIVDENVNSAHFTATISSHGAKLTKCEGDATQDVVCKLPLGAGAITVKAVSFPIAQGSRVPIAVEVQTSFLIPSSLASVDTAVRANDQNGESVICLDVHTEKQGDAGGVTITTGTDYNNKYCLDLPGGDTSNGNAVWLWDCSGQISQQWVFDQNTGNLRYAGDLSKCVDIKNGQLSAGTYVQIWDCYDGLAQQTFGYDSNSHALYASASTADASLCVDLRGGSPYDGASVWLWDCNGMDAQVWYVWGTQMSSNETQNFAGALV